MITQRQLQVLRLYAQGKKTIEIASELSISCRTVEFHLVGAKKSLDAVNSVNAVAIAAKRGLISVLIMISSIQGVIGDSDKSSKEEEEDYPISMIRPPVNRISVRKINS